MKRRELSRIRLVEGPEFVDILHAVTRLGKRSHGEKLLCGIVRVVRMMPQCGSANQTFAPRSPSKEHIRVVVIIKASTFSRSVPLGVFSNTETASDYYTN